MATDKNNYSDSPSDLLTVNDLCEILQIGRNSAYLLLSSGQISGFRIGRRSWRIPKESLAKYIIKKLQRCRK